MSVKYVFGKINRMINITDPSIAENISRFLRYLIYAESMAQRYKISCTRDAYLRRRRSFVTKYIERATDRMERITVRIGLICSHWSSLTPANVPARMITSI